MRDIGLFSQRPQPHPPPQISILLQGRPSRFKATHQYAPSSVLARICEPFTSKILDQPFFPRQSSSPPSYHFPLFVFYQRMVPVLAFFISPSSHC